MGVALCAALFAEVVQRLALIDNVNREELERRVILETNAS